MKQQFETNRQFLLHILILNNNIETGFQTQVGRSPRTHFQNKVRYQELSVFFTIIRKYHVCCNNPFSLHLFLTETTISIPYFDCRSRSFSVCKYYGKFLATSIRTYNWKSLTLNSYFNSLLLHILLLYRGFVNNYFYISSIFE